MAGTEVRALGGHDKPINAGGRILMPSTNAGASRPKPRPPVYDEEFAKRAREATREATERKGKGR